jgi:hypothetical protein
VDVEAVVVAGVLVVRPEDARVLVSHRHLEEPLECRIACGAARFRSVEDERGAIYEGPAAPGEVGTEQVVVPACQARQVCAKKEESRFSKINFFVITISVI